MATVLTKFSLLGVVSDHYATFRNAATCRRSVTDFAIFLGVPVLLGIAVWWFNLHANALGDVLAAAAILTGLIFNVFVLLFDLTMRAADRTDPAHMDKVVGLADELRANVSYAVLLGIGLTALLAGFVMFGPENEPMPAIPSALVVAVGTQMLFTIAMILKRIRALYRAFRITQPERIP